MKDENQKTKTCGKKHFFRRFFLFLRLILLTAAGYTDYIFETQGIPDFLRVRIVEIIRRKGLKLQAEEIRAGIVRGIYLDKVRFSDPKQGFSSAAPYLILRFSPLEDLFPDKLPFRMQTQNAFLTLSMLPEYGEESSGDQMTLHLIKADIVRSPEDLRIHRLQAESDLFLLNCSGNIHLDNAPETISGGNKQKTGSRIPLELREKIQRFAARMQGYAPQGKIICCSRFSLDTGSYQNCMLSAELLLPKIQFQHLKIRETQLNLTLANGTVTLEPSEIELEDSSRISFAGKYHDDGHFFSGTCMGECKLEHILSFADTELQEFFRKYVETPSKTVHFQANLQRFQTESGMMEGDAVIRLPDITIAGIPVRNAVFEVHAHGNKISGILQKAELAEKGSLEGKFYLDGKSFVCSLSGKTNGKFFTKFLPDSIRTLTEDPQKIQISDSNELFFSATLEIPDLSRAEYAGTLQASVPEIKLKSLPFSSISFSLDFTHNDLVFKELHASAPGNTEFSGEMILQPDELLSATLSCSGKTSAILQNITTVIGKEQAELYFGELELPAEGDSMEMHMELFKSLDGTDFFQAQGSLAARNFTWRKIPFLYGAAAFYTRNPEQIVLPEMELQTKDGTIQLRAIYTAGSEHQVYFQLKSTIIGNDLIRMFYPEWNCMFIDFPYPMLAESSGSIDYLNTDNIALEAKIINGTCTTAGSRTENVNSEITLKNGILRAQKSSGLFCGGHLAVDYSYNIEQDNGTFAVKYTSISLPQFLQSNHITSLMEKSSEKDTINGTASGTYDYENGTILQLHGSGDFVLKGENLWNIPIMGDFLSQLAKAWPMINIGSITTIHGYFDLLKDRFVLKKIEGDGMLISLGSDGYYNWRDGDYDLNLRAELLKNALPFDVMSRILTPISWILTKKISGKIDKSNTEKQP